MKIPDNRTEAFALVQRALRIQLGNEEGDLAEAESCLLKALDLDPVGIEALPLRKTSLFYLCVLSGKEGVIGLLRGLRRFVHGHIRETVGVFVLLAPHVLVHHAIEVFGERLRLME